MPNNNKVLISYRVKITYAGESEPSGEAGPFLSTAVAEQAVIAAIARPDVKSVEIVHQADCLVRPE